MLPIKLALAIGHRELRAEAAEVLEASPVRVVADCACFSSRRAFLAQVARAQPQIVLLEISELPTSLDDAVESLRLAAPAMVVALDRAADSEAILRAVRAGVDDYLYPPMHFTLRKLLERKSQELLQPCGVAAGGSVLAFLSARSGCGATTLACRVAGELAARGAGCGRRALLAGPGAMEHIPATDAGRWRAQVSAAPGGLDVLPATRETFSAGRLREFVSYIRARYRWSVLDLGHGWTPAACDAARFADQLFPVFTPELPALKTPAGCWSGCSAKASVKKKRAWC